MFNTPLVAIMPHSESRSREPSAKGASSRGPHNSVGTPHFLAIIAAAPSVPKLQCGMNRASIRLLLEVADHRPHVFLVADHPVGKHLFQVHVANLPAVEPLADQPLEANGILMGEDKLADRAQPHHRLLAIRHVPPRLRDAFS